MTDPVIAALQQALAAGPNLELHLALGDRYAAIGQPADAARCYADALALQPAHVVALGKAFSAAEAAGMSAQAEGWRRLHAALTGGASPAAPTLSVAPPQMDAPRPARVTPEGEPEGGGSVIRLVPAGDEAERTTFVDIGGLEAVKKRIDLAFLAPLRNPALYRQYGRSIKGGLLLYGPPGCGKTHLARATAGEVGARFTSIGLVDVLDMWMGESEKRLHELFENARRQAPVVLFLDELDALGQKRSQMRSQSGYTLVNQLLVEMDGLDSGEGVYVLAATNHPWDVDPALKRPGRFDRTVLVPPPDAPARAHILRRHLRGKPQEGLDFDAIAGRSEGFSGADLVHLADTAVERVLEEALAGGEARPVRMADFGSALQEVRPSIGPWVDTARNYAVYANEGGAYDELAAWLKSRK